MKTNNSKNPLNMKKYLFKISQTQFHAIILALFALFFQLNASGQIAGCPFSQAAGSWSPISGGTVPSAIGSGWADGTSSAQPIGFTFNYNNTSFTTFGISPNGYIIMGSGGVVNTYCGPQGAASNPNMIAAWAHDYVPVSTLSGEV